MFKKHFLPIAFALATVMSSQVVRAADEYTESEPVERSYLNLGGGCIDVWATTSQDDALRYGDPIPVRVLFVLHPTAVCQKKAPEVSLLPPTAVASAVVSATPSTPGAGAPNAPDIAKVLLPVPLVVPEIDLKTIKSGKLTNSPSDVVALSIGATGEELIDKDCGLPCGKTITQDLIVTQRITMQTIPPAAGATASSAKPDDKTPPKYKKRATIIMDFDYALFKAPGDDQPAWQTGQTKALVVAIHQSAGISEIDPAASESLLKEGDGSAKVSPLPPAYYWMRNLAIALALPMVISVVLAIIWLVRRERVLSVNEKVWKVIDDAVKAGEAAEANGEHFPIEQYRRIFYVLRKHFDILGRDTTQTLKNLSERDNLDAIAVGHVFNRETLFFDESRTVPAEDRAEFLRNIQVLIPRR